MNSNLQKITDLANQLMKYNEMNLVHRLYQKINKLLETEVKPAKLDPSVPAQYEKLMLKLKFFSLNFFEEEDYLELIKEHLNIALEIPDFDLWDKIKILLISYNDFEARDQLKEKIKNVLLGCNNQIINVEDYKNKNNDRVDDLPAKVGDWVKSFIVNLGDFPFDALKKQEYLSNNEFVKILKPEDKEKIKRLLDFYENLGLSSVEKEGNENAILADVNNKLFILHKGEEEFLGKNMEEIKSLDKKVRSNSLPVKNDGQPISSAPPKAKNVNILASEKIGVSELEEDLKNYPPSSLEHKAIKEEISRLKKAAVKKAAPRK